jgi:hypothetical protein
LIFHTFLEAIYYSQDLAGENAEAAPDKYICVRFFRFSVHDEVAFVHACVKMVHRVS